MSEIRIVDDPKLADRHDRDSRERVERAVNELLRTGQWRAVGLAERQRNGGYAVLLERVEEEEER